MGEAVDDLIEATRLGSPISANDVSAVLDEILVADATSGWLRDEELALGSKRWRPSALSGDRSVVLYICLLQEFPRFVVERLRLCKAAGLELRIALTVSALFQAEILEVLVDLDCDVLVVDDYNKARRMERRHVLTALADIEVPLSSEVRRDIGRRIWARVGEGTAQERGRRLEGLLAFIFAQVQDLKVVEHNYRNATEEIDLVLQVDNFSSRVWQNSGVPFILVEAKNRVDKASQAMMSILITKLQTKRGTAKIGIMVSLAGFTDEAKMQELRFSTENVCVAMIDRQGVETLIEASDLDETLEIMVRQALLR